MAVEPTLDLARVIESRNFVSLQEMLKHWTPPTAAGLIEALPVEQQVLAFRVLPRDLAADVFEYLPLEAQEHLLKAMAKEEVAQILNEMAPDDRTALLDELPATVTQQLLQLLTPEERSVAVKLLGYTRAASAGFSRRTTSASGPTGPWPTCSTTSGAMDTTARRSRSST